MGSRIAPGASPEVFAMRVELSPKERLSKMTEILAEGVLALLRSLPFPWAMSRVKVSELVKVRVVAADGASDVLRSVTESAT
jgi:hypothetical protein